MRNKICIKCTEEKDILCFSKKTKGKRNSYCKECTRAYSKLHYKNDPRPYLERVEAKRNRLVKLLREHKDNKPCSDCGKIYRYYVLDLDHRPGETKVKEVSSMVSQKTSIEVFLAEIAKCDLVCSNCHRERTYQRSILG